MTSRNWEDAHPRWFVTVSQSQAEGTYRLDFGGGDMQMALFAPLADLEQFAQQIMTAVQHKKDPPIT